MQELKKIGVLSVAKIGGIFGLVMGVLSVVLTKIICSQPNVAEVTGMAFQCEAMNATGILLAVISAGVGYFLVGLIGAALYNLFAKWIGGVKVDFGKTGKK